MNQDIQEDASIVKEATVIDMKLLNSEVYRVILKCNDGIVPNYKAGQYLKILDKNNNSYCFSIACAPSNNQQTIELHIAHNKNSSASNIVFEQLYSKQIVIQLPFGNCFIDRKLEYPIIFIAAATGFAQTKSFIEYCINVKHSHAKTLYWGVNLAEQLYMDIPQIWLNNNIRYVPLVDQPDNTWSGRTGFPMKAIVEDVTAEPIDKNTHFYITGSPAMVKSTIDYLKSELSDINHVHSDML